MGYKYIYWERFNRVHNGKTYILQRRIGTMSYRIYLVNTTFGFEYFKGVLVKNKYGGFSLIKNKDIFRFDTLKDLFNNL